MDCPICKLPEKDLSLRFAGDRAEVECPRCGRYDITDTARAIAEERAANYRLSAWIRNREPQSDPPLITSATLDEVAKGLPRYSVTQKQLLLLKALERASEEPGRRVHVEPTTDFTLAACSSVSEMEYVIRALMGRNLVTLLKWSDPSESFSLELTITPQGWTLLDEHARSPILSNQAFVAMSFAGALSPAWKQAIEPALREAGYQPYRVDAQPHIDRIDTKIVAEIRNSRLLVADVTLQRPGVYFEAGFALGLGIPVFWCVREDDLPNVHFDTRQYNHIVWQSEQHLRDQLYLFVLAVLGRGTAA